MREMRKTTKIIYIYIYIYCCTLRPYKTPPSPPPPPLFDVLSASFIESVQVFMCYLRGAHDITMQI
jgi:hypothetical protein